MNDLLDSAVAAHGGLDRWNQVTSIACDAPITGAFWHLKGQGDALKDVRLEVDTTRQRLAVDFAGQDKRSASSSRSRCWSLSTWARSPSGDLAVLVRAGRSACGSNSCV